MRTDRKTLLAPIVLIALGAGWLLTVLEVAPRIDWILIFSLAAVALLTFVLGGFNKVAIVIGPLFALAAFLSILRQTDQMSLKFEVPVFVLALGVLLLVARSASIPVPSWLIDDMKRGMAGSRVSSRSGTPQAVGRSFRVETAITGHPPHRSGRDQFGHPVPR